MASISGLRQVGWFDCPGGGQVRVDGTTAYLGHMSAPHGTSIADVSDPAHPRLLSRLEVSPGAHSHKVRPHGDIMLVNQERTSGPASDAFVPGLAIYDVSDLTAPRHISTWETTGRGVHRFDFGSIPIKIRKPP